MTALDKLREYVLRFYASGELPPHRQDVIEIAHEFLKTDLANQKYHEDKAAERGKEAQILHDLIDAVRGEQETCRLGA